jgi:mannose/cellobiose epimerase-like protein (N-acyl-D-glucosamine 2-epimerase family)
MSGGSLFALAGDGRAGEGRLSEINGVSLEAIRDRFSDDLHNRIMPLIYDVCYDKQHGGFTCEVNFDGSLATSEKNMWYQTRGLWLLCYYYNHFNKDPKYLEAARKTRDFLVRFGRDEDGYWYFRLTRAGKPVRPSSDSIHSDIFALYGFTEHYRATKDESSLAIADETVHKIMKRILDPSFQYMPDNEPGTSILGVWLHLLGGLTQLAMLTDDKAIESLARFCRRRITQYHVREDLQYTFEWLQSDLQPFPEQEYRFALNGHAIETAWILMIEALRIRDRRLFDIALKMTRWHLQMGWDDEGGGGLVGAVSPENRSMRGDGSKSSWRCDEALVALILAVEFTHAQWAIQWYDKVRRYAYATFTDPSTGRWVWHAARDGSRYKRPRIENFHHPRSVMLNIESLNRMIGRKGQAAAFPATDDASQ